MSQKYPVVIIPQAVCRAAVHLPEVKHPNPKKPYIKPRPQKPEPGKKPEPIYNQLTFGTSAVILLLSIAIGYTFHFLNLHFGIILGATLFGLYLGFFMPKLNRHLKEDFKKQKAEYESELRKVKKYPNELKEWQLYCKKEKPLILKNYNEKLRLHDEEVKQISNIIQQQQNYFQRITVSSPQYNNAKKGYLEDYFYGYLTRYFSNKIYQSLALTKYANYPYTPDFCYYNEAWNLRIDIEIDEPYSYINKQPTHFTDLTKEKTRDEFFIANNWVVVRFAEEQVARQPKSCCKFIAQKLNLLIATNIPETLINEPELREIKRWNYSEAQRMADENYRDTYLH